MIKIAHVVALWLLCQPGLSQELRQQAPVLDRPIPVKNEPAMTPGMQIIVDSPTGKVKIEAGSGLKRSFSWSGDTRSIEMWPREERYFGSLGLYFPGPGEHWVPLEGITRCVANEGQLNFSSTKQALAWLSETPSFVRRVYTSNGLSIWVNKSARDHNLGIEIFQVYVKGHKPQELPHSEDGRITVEGPLPIPETTSAPCVRKAK